MQGSRVTRLNVKPNAELRQLDCLRLLRLTRLIFLHGWITFGAGLLTQPDKREHRI